MRLLLLVLLCSMARAFVPGFVGLSAAEKAAMSKQSNAMMFDTGSHGDLTETTKLIDELSAAHVDVPDLLEEFRSEILKRDALVERLLDESSALLPLDGDSMSLDEHANDFSIIASTGGVAKDNLHVSVADSVLTIEGDTRGEEPGRSWRSSFSQSLRLPSDADWQSPDVRVVQDERGTLNVRIPKRATLKQARDTPRRVFEIQATPAIMADEEWEQAMLTLPDVEGTHSLPNVYAEDPSEAEDAPSTEVPDRPWESYVGRRRILRDM